MEQSPNINRSLRLLWALFSTVGNTLSAIVIVFLLFWLIFSSAQLTHAQSPIAPMGWQPFPPMRSGVGDPSVIEVDGKIHVIGGVEFFGSSSLHEAFDPLTKQWESLPDLPSQLSNAAAAAVGGKLYVMGGYNLETGGALTSTYIYLPATRHWITATSMISPASGAGVAVINDEIYIFGGFDNYAESARVQRYNPLTDQWTLHTPMPVARSEFGMVTVDGLLYAIGGNVRPYTGTLSTTVQAATATAMIPTVSTLSTLVSVYNPTSDIWRNVASLPMPRISMAVAVLDNQIYVMGGVDVWLSGTVQSVAYVYTPVTDQWSTMPPMLSARSGVRAITLGALIYAIGGYDQSFLPLATNEVFGFPIEMLYLPIISQF